MRKTMLVSGLLTAITVQAASIGGGEIRVETINGLEIRITGYSGADTFVVIPATIALLGTGFMFCALQMAGLPPSTFVWRTSSTTFLNASS